VPTHVFLQAGVGAMAGALAAFFADCYRGSRPTVVVVEADAADCILRTAEADDGSLHAVDGDLATIMAGLACGEPCSIAWEMLRRFADHFVSVPDELAARGMRILANPVDTDAPIVSDESGAVTAGLVAELMTSGDLAGMRNAIGLGPDSKVLCISTEGATDRENYARIVHGGC
jgi:diaminopropionate ammonia-lyase